MTPAELLSQFRDEMSDTETPYLWGDTLVFGYIDDAQNQFCRATDGIPDASSALTTLSIVPPTEWYDLSPKIIKLRSAYRTDTGRPVPTYNQEKMAERAMFFDGRSGPLNAIIIGMEDAKVRVWPVPDETVTVKLTVFRYPLVTISDANADTELEIQPQHHAHLLMWVKYRAYMKQDAETFNRTKADEFKAAFDAYCAQVKEEQRRARLVPRSVAYGGL